jgi:hypothetical protein
MRAYASGDRVNHSQYGDGTIDSVNEYHTKITFDEHGLRTFQSSRAAVRLWPRSSRALQLPPVHGPSRWHLALHTAALTVSFQRQTPLPDPLASPLL